MDHDLLNLTDLISLIGELEHMRRHAKRSMHVAKNDEDKIFYGVLARKAQDARRALQHRYFETDDLDWCLVKCAATIKQLAYEAENDPDGLSELEVLSDIALTHALKQDMTGCKSCASDKEQGV